MSEGTNGAWAPSESATGDRSDLLAILTRVGLKTLRTKLFTLILFLTGLAILITCTVAYFGFHRAIEASADLRHTAASTAETVNLLIPENIQFIRALANDEALMSAAEAA